MELVLIEWNLLLLTFYGIQVTASTQDNGNTVISSSDRSCCQSLTIVQGCNLPSLGTGYPLPFPKDRNESVHLTGQLWEGNGGKL